LGTKKEVKSAPSSPWRSPIDAAFAGEPGEPGGGGVRYHTTTDNSAYTGTKNRGLFVRYMQNSGMTDGITCRQNLGSKYIGIYIEKGCTKSDYYYHSNAPKNRPGHQ
jgi:hypothetical protein